MRTSAITDEIFLHGIALSNYRAIGNTLTKIGPFKRFNFIIGPNNSGKSCVLHFIANHLKSLVSEPLAKSISLPQKQLEALDCHLGASQSQVEMAVGVPISKVAEAISFGLQEDNNFHGVFPLINTILSKISDQEILWLYHEKSTTSLKVLGIDLRPEFFKGLMANHEWQALWHCLTKKSGGDLLQHWIPESIRYVIQQAPVTLPKISLIPAIREISAKGQPFLDWSGSGLIEQLALLQNPGVMDRQRVETFERINCFLRAVTQNSSSKIEIPYERDCVLVHMNDKVLPLSSLGTGIHEIVMLAAFCTLMENQIVCIEEPEIHLHPVLQRRLIQYLDEQTSNQYFIATHSASFIDTPGAAVFHVTNRDGEASVHSATTDTKKFDACRDLGYKASDLLQANSIIWVEGPSDRIYLKHWIAAVDPELREGIHYSIMFYGGRLLSHLSAIDLEEHESSLDAMVELLRLNRNLAIMIDSDKSEINAPINKTKERLKTEMDSISAIAWITAGREIENYIPKDLITEALAETYNKYGSRMKTGPYDHVLPFKDLDNKKVESINKVKVARSVCNKPANLDILDLRTQIEKVVTMIHGANI